MLIQAYRVESHRPGLPDGIPLTPVPIGIVQFTGGSDEGRPEWQRQDMATDLLIYHSPLVDDLAFGHITWHAEKTSIDDDTLGTPFFEDAAEGYRIWLPTMPYDHLIY